MAPKVPCKKTPDKQIEDPKFVVAIDFGTTFSKAAYVDSAHLEPGFLEIEKMVHLITDWPSQEAGGGGKCFKTKTCVWYMPGDKPHTYAMKAWGWEAYVQYKKLVQSQAKAGAKATAKIEELGNGDTKKTRNSPGKTQELLFKQHGFLIDCFKLRLYDQTMGKDLPTGLFLQEIISDFLRGMTAHILSELRQKHGRHVYKRDIKWCITVPALWEEPQRRQMEDCAELAGLVQGPSCKDKSASPHDLIAILEPEAASIYCHNTLKLFRHGDKFAVVDLGGGTTDLVTHESIGSTTRSNVRVKEVAESNGGLCGGVHVDQRFLDYLRKRIRTPTSECFKEFEELYPAQVLEMLIHWGRIKATYEGEVECSKVYELDIPRTLAKSWKKSHKKYLQSGCMDASLARNHYVGPADYNQIDLRSSTVKKIFDRDIESILSLIKKRDIDTVDFVVIVGGFSESPYVRKRIMESFSSSASADQGEKTSKIIFPRYPDTAVVRGAVVLGLLGEWESFVKSRIAKKTYGFDTTMPFNEELHPVEYLVYQDDTKEKHCDHVFETLIRRGDEVPFDLVVEYNTTPLYREGHSDDENVEISLYSTRERNPKFVLEKGVTKEASCVIPVPKASDKGKGEGKEPQMTIRVSFGGTRIRLSVWGDNFSGEKIAMDPVKLSYTGKNQLDHGKLRKCPLDTKNVIHGKQKLPRMAVKREGGS